MHNLDIFLPEAGFLALLLSLGVNVLTPLATWCGMGQHWRGVMRLTTCGAWTAFTLLLLAFAILVSCFLTSDFSVVYVAQHSHSQLSWGLKLAAVWGGHEGSLLLWVLFLSGWSALFALCYRRDSDPLFPLTLSVLSMVTALLLLFVVVWSDPFARIFPPAIEGRDLNPMLQHLGLILHPPLLYLGYGGLMVAAGVALASLLRGDFNAQSAWVCWRWALPGWCALTLGIILGSWWAYCELGWGGWWFWDPVENASLLPWLSASALLHSLFVTRQRGIFRHWSLLLAIVTLILSLLGTLIVRSGILVSVHAFALDNVRAAPLFALFSVLSLASLGLYAWRGQQVRLSARFGGWSREMLILVALLLFCAVLLIVLIGTLYPVIYGLFGWGRLSVGAPYFNRATLPFGLLMLLVIVLATIRSRKVSLRCQLPALLAHAGVLVFAAGIVFSSGSRQEISLNLSPGQQVDLAGYIFRFERLDLEAKGNYTSEKALITLWQNEQRIGSLQPERRFYAARRQQMMEPGIRWNLMHDWYAVMGEKTGPDRYAMRLYVQTGVRWIWGGGLLMVFGALLSAWRGRKHPELLPDGAALIRPTSEKQGRPDKAFTPPSGKTMLLLALLIFLPFATHAQVVDTWTFANPQQQEKALSIASQLRCPQCQNQNLLESNAPVAVSMRHQVYSMVAEGKSEAEITAWMTDRYGDFVRYNPPLNEQTLLLWALPYLLLLLVGVVAWRVRKRQHAGEGEQ
ncbi:heme lyase NrfEFG subunit NrfF [Salmonella enterica]|uniref:Formate-dependent nitrite reductase complex subunit n=10 Tax=Salmonella enterica TaxID=28901 RepID=A0A607SKN6_SALER|nr:heme lyase NrfEFG subunit NrfF [Salmonella enterica]EAA8226892.1 heme lyase NrfEFG subunit NrfF [Salmonella enterica subsp. enterica]EBR0123171.1 heme lyase NrfEFG subunit NrfF [Salmonella enterica subsp. enterica serovar Sinstorf]EBY2074969.1 heme lyase NrfEFG subunit NrfF [Salmonella enterica subsp. enterica serovar Zanzibar]ECO0590246.1 heme lyase NrfEFG subunit NrfF [Salmonella enterica subsp. enterica serovar Muenchen]EDE1818230.1 heme lyase NrfEFG subunit NrfF [Salmonella enterica sub